MIGQTLGRYRLLEEIGSGGMGVVYRARDERLDRDVAVKVLGKIVLTDDGARRGLRREAMALSKLNHPGIATLHDFGCHQGVDFLVMELIPGVSLKERQEGRALPEDEVIRLGTQMLDALAAAHDKGIVHRDLKPANLRITPEGRLKILDFGLARLRPSGQEDISTGTAAGDLVTGTLPYMAPEHLRGQEVDTRTDVHAAGAVLYEMATGRRAFPQGGAELIDAILNRPPAPLRHLDPSVSPALEAVVLRALEKSPGRRYQSARELLHALERVAEPTRPDWPAEAAAPRRRSRFLLTAGLPAVVALLVAGLLSLPGTRQEEAPATSRIASVAVLPLENTSRDPEQEYFADGMTEALIAELARVGSLRVISRTSAMHYKGTRKRLPEVARELGVDAVVEGSVLRAGERVRITAQLVHAGSDRNLWSETYERALSDVLSLQAEVARAVTRHVAASISSEDQARLTLVRSVDPAVYQLYLKGRFAMNQGRVDALRQAATVLEEAARQDPAYAAAWSGLADVYLRLDDFDAMAEAEAREKARQAARKAIDLDDGLAEAHASLGHLAIHEWQWPVADAEFRRAVELEPSYALAHQFYSAYLAAMGRSAEAVQHAQRARTLDPLSTDTGVTLAWQLYLARRFDEAVATGRALAAAEPAAPRVHWRLACALLARGETAAAAAELERFASLASPPRRALAVRALAQARQGRRDRALALLEDLRRAPHDGYEPEVEVALVHAALGRPDEAFAELEKAYERRLEWLGFLNVDPLFDPLRSDPRFAALVRRVGLPAMVEAAARTAPAGR